MFTKYKEKFNVCLDDIHPNSSMKVRVTCDYCGTEYKIPYFQYTRAMNKRNNIACQKCSGIKVAQATLERRIDNLYGRIQKFCEENNYNLITEKKDIINIQSYVKYICPIHGEVTTKVANILQGKHCYKCSRKLALIKKSEITLKQRQNSLFERAMVVASTLNYVITTDISEISKNTDYIEYICPKHGKKKTRISNLISGKKCPECAKEMASIRNRLSQKDVIDKVKLYGGVLINPEDYVNNNVKNLKFICSECGEIFISSLSNFTQHHGQVCSKCSHKESVGERKIRKYLELNGIEYVQEKQFRDCIDIRPLPFDFYLPDYNVAIEFDGEQHYFDRGTFSTSLEYVKKHDDIKNNYCKANGIFLIRIPYWKINTIETYLNMQLKNLSLHKDIV